MKTILPSPSESVNKSVDITICKIGQYRISVSVDKVRTCVILSPSSQLG